MRPISQERRTVIENTTLEMIGYNCTDREFDYHRIIAYATYFTREKNSNRKHNLRNDRL